MKNTRQNSASIKKKVTNVLVHLFLTILSVIWVFPIFWVVLLSFREQKGQYITSFWPTKFTTANYVKLFTDTALFNFPRWFLNTLFVAICSCILTTFFVLAISYCLSRLRFKIRKPYMNVAMILGMFPGFMSMIAIYYILKGFGLTKGPMIYLALIMVYSGSAGLGFYVSKGFFDTIPKALDEAAIVDGATKWDVFSKIIMPLSKPIVVSTILTSFMSPWLDFIFAKVIAGADPRYYTVAIGLYTMLTKENIDRIAKEVVRLCEQEKDTDNLKQLKRLLKENERATENLFKALESGQIVDVIAERISQKKRERNELEQQILVETSSHPTPTVNEVRFFLNQFRKGDVNDLKYRRALVDTFVNRIYLYDDKMTVLYNTQDSHSDVTIDDLSSSRVVLVDLMGFEPTTSRMRTERAPSCATGPFRIGTLTL